jgi:hypothetical protein
MLIPLKPKPKRISTSLIKLAEPEQKWLKQVPRLSLNAFKNKTQTITDWNNVTFRIKVGVELAKKIYTEETFSSMNEVLSVCLKLGEEYRKTNILNPTAEEIETMEIGIDAVDSMQDETLRKDQVIAYRTTDAFMKKLIN